MRVDELEKDFDSCPSDREELNRRNGVIQYVIVSLVTLDIKYLPGSLRTSTNDCGCRPRSLEPRDLLAVLKTSKTLPNSSNIYGKLSSTTRFARDLRSLVSIDADNR